APLTDAQPSSTSPNIGARERAARFCRRFGLRVPILQAPMAGACPTSLASAVANAGGMGGLGALMTPPDGIARWVREFRDQSNGGFQINLWIPDPPPVRDPEHERKVRDFLEQWGAAVPAEAGDAAAAERQSVWRSGKRGDGRAWSRVGQGSGDRGRHRYGKGSLVGDRRRRPPQVNTTHAAGRIVLTADELIGRPPARRNVGISR